MNTTSEIELVTGDITLELSDAIVNPAGAGLVDLAIRRAAGPLLVEELHQRLFESGDAKLMPGRAIVTRGFGLPALHVIHCGPPVYFDGPVRSREDLAACHVEALRLARARGFASLLVPRDRDGRLSLSVQEAADRERYRRSEPRSPRTAARAARALRPAANAASLECYVAAHRELTQHPPVEVRYALAPIGVLPALAVAVPVAATDKVLAASMPNRIYLLVGVPDAWAGESTRSRALVEQ